MARVRFGIGEQSWVFDDGDLTLKDAFAIKAASGLTPKAMLGGLEEMDPAALQALVWFLRTKNGEAGLSISDVDFRLGDLSAEQLDSDPS